MFLCTAPVLPRAFAGVALDFQPHVLSLRLHRSEALPPPVRSGPMALLPGTWAVLLQRGGHVGSGFKQKDAALEGKGKRSCSAGASPLGTGCGHRRPGHWPLGVFSSSALSEEPQRVLWTEVVLLLNQTFLWKNGVIGPRGSLKPLSTFKI